MADTESVESPAVQPSDKAKKYPQEQQQQITSSFNAPGHNDDTQSEPANIKRPEPDDAKLSAKDAPEKVDQAEKGGEGPQVEENPPLPPGPPPGETPTDDGWQPVWDATYGSYYFYNALTGETTWTNPRVPEATVIPPAVLGAEASPEPTASDAANHLQYNPAIHGDYDETAPYAQKPEDAEYTATASFNRFTGKFQSASSHLVPENYTDEKKSKRQMEFYFDVDAAANNHDGKSLKAERQTKKLSKKELKQFKEKRRARKEEKRKAWLKD